MVWKRQDEIWREPVKVLHCGVTRWGELTAALSSRGSQGCCWSWLSSRQKCHGVSESQRTSPWGTSRNTAGGQWKWFFLTYVEFILCVGTADSVLRWHQYVVAIFSTLFRFAKELRLSPEGICKKTNHQKTKTKNQSLTNLSAVKAQQEFGGAALFVAWKCLPTCFFIKGCC